MKYIIDDINNYDEYFYKKYFKKYKSIINLKINNEKRMKQSILSRYLLEQLIGSNLDNFVYNEYGKPFFLDNNIYFNVSHSADYVAVVISSKKVGIDIEHIRSINTNVIDKFATVKEKEYILKDKDKIYDRLFLVYTLKEAYFKMLGKDLTNVLDIEFIDNYNIACSNKNVNINYFFEDSFVISICEEKNNS